MSTEQAIIELVVSGQGQFEQTNDKVQVDLTSTERAGKSAEAAAAAATKSAASANAAAVKLEHQVGHVLHGLHRAVSAAERAATALGVDKESGAGQGLDALGGAIAGAHQGFRLGALFGPEGAAIGGVIGSLSGLVASLNESEKRIRDAADRSQQEKPNEITEALLREAGLANLDHAVARGGRQVQ